jgi:hypothetical protein
MKTPPNFDRRQFFGAAAASFAAGALGLSALASQRSHAMNAAVEKVNTDRSAVRSSARERFATGFHRGDEFVHCIDERL